MSPLNPFKIDDTALRSKFYRQLVLMIVLGGLLYLVLEQPKALQVIMGVLVALAMVPVLMKWGHGLYIATLRMLVKHPLGFIAAASAAVAAAAYFGFDSHDMRIYAVCGTIVLIWTAIRLVLWLSHPSRNGHIEAAEHMF